MSRKVQFRLLVALTAVWGLWAAWSMFARTSPVTVRVIDDVGLPVADAGVSLDGRPMGSTAADGTIVVDWPRPASGLDVMAPGYEEASLDVGEPGEAPIEVVMRPRLLRGRVTDPQGNMVAGAYVLAGAGNAVSDGEGRFVVRKAEPGAIEVWRPAWQGATVTWDGGAAEIEATISPQVIRAVHLGGEAVQKSLGYFLDMTERTDVNGLMIDLKDETGSVFYDSSIQSVQAVRSKWLLYDLPEVVRQADQRGVYLIGRIVAFQDPIASIRAPEMAVWDTQTDAPYHKGAQYFLDPSDQAAQEYALELGREACIAGVDEIQFDYVRYPDGRPDWARFDQPTDEATRVATIRDFLATAVADLHPLGCAVAADVFGFTTQALDDGGIGQQWETVTEVVDVASPMLYPSHYGNGWNGYDDPNDHPAAIVSDALESGLERLSRRIIVRPWLQDFGYQTEEVEAQIDQAEQRGLGWMLWNSRSEFTEDALGPPSD
ncbi:MAG TPA: putative glycoside hydrolase [Acidimicrobiia bacterium]